MSDSVEEVEDGSEKQALTLRRAAIDFFFVFLLLGSIVSLLAFVPTNPPEVLARPEAIVAICVAGSILLTLLILAFRLGLLGILSYIGEVLANLVGKRGAVVFALYLLGFLVCERIKLSPPLEEWTLKNPELWSFAGIYTAIAFVFLACLKLGEDAAQVAKGADWDPKKLGSIVDQIKPIAFFLAVPMYIAGLVVVEWLGFAPSFSFSNLISRGSLSFIAVYSVGFLLLPLALALLLWLVVLIFRLIADFFRLVANSERWRRIRGARLSKSELETRLRQERAERDDIAKAWRVQKAGEKEGRIRGRRDELAVYGSVTARWLWWSPIITLGAQIFSFVTSYLGIRIYLDLRQQNTEWFGYNLPSWFNEFFSMPIETRLSIMSNDTLAIACSFFMATLIWALSALAVGRVRKQQKVPFVIFLFIVALGLSSTYTAFIFWNGEVATQAQLRKAHRETEKLLVSVESVDERNLGNPMREVANLETQTKNLLVEQQIRLLRGHLLDVQNVLDEHSQSFSSIGGLEYYLTSGRDFYQTFLECELERGCLSDLSGRGEVAKSLEQNVQAFENNLATWNKINETRQALSETAQVSALSAIESMQDRDLKSALREIAKVRAAIISMTAEDPVVIFGSIRSRLSVPIESDAPSESQREALDGLRQGIQSDLEELGVLATAHKEVEFLLPPEIRIDQINPMLQQDLGLLSQIRSELEDLTGRRSENQKRVRSDLFALDATIELNSREKRLVSGGNELFENVNVVRDRIDSFGNVDPRPIFAKANFLVSEDLSEVTLEGLNPENLSSYPTVMDFNPEIIAVSILTHANLSIVPLMLQVMLDFGFTLIVVIVAWRLRKRNLNFSDDDDAQRTG